MRFKTFTSPHSTAGNRVNKVMLHVLLGLLPGVIALFWFFGWGVLINLVIACVAALISEAAILILRKKPVLPALLDGSALVTACLLALALPSLAPWWLTIIGVSFAIIFAKQLYGGLGYNPFNPAMVGYVVLLISFPLEMTQWLRPEHYHASELSFIASLQAIFLGNLQPGVWDALSGATPLDAIKTGLSQAQTISEIKTLPLFGYWGGQAWEWVNISFLLGGIYLLYVRVITWHIPVALIVSLLLVSGVGFLIDPSYYPSPLLHIVSGATMIGAFFIATDPVSACTSNKGKLIYGASIGLLTYVIRTWGGYPDGIAFAVLLMNMSAPFIDYYTKPKVFGQV